jgi:glycerate 2-kinase
MRILNAETLIGHGNVAGRRAVVEILEAGMQAADPYEAVRQLIRVDGDQLIVGHRAFEPRGSPVTGDEVYDLSGPGRVYVLGAGKGVQRVAKAIEDILGNRLAGGHVIDKEGGAIILERIGVTLGAHPVPDENCVRGCERILEMTRGLAADDLVFTVGASGFSSLLTLPVPGVSLEDVRRTVYLMQIERGAPTGDLSPIRNHLDMMKGGQIAAHIHPARAIHLLAKPPDTYEGWIYNNTWVHTFPDRSTFADAVHNLIKWDAWDAVPRSVREHLERADPQYETIKPERYQRFSYRIYGIMPGQQGEWPAAKAKAEELGFRAVNLAMGLNVEASYAGQVVATIANTIGQCPQRAGVPFEPPLVLLTAGEMLVTVGRETGIGGRNQEYALAAAQKIAGSEQIVIGAVDTDGTDGPGAQYVDGSEHIPTLAGGLVDGFTVREAEERGLDIRRALNQHNATPILLSLDSGVLATQSTGLQDLGVLLVLGR